VGFTDLSSRWPSSKVAQVGGIKPSEGIICKWWFYP